MGNVDGMVKVKEGGRWKGDSTRPQTPQKCQNIPQKCVFPKPEQTNPIERSREHSKHHIKLRMKANKIQMFMQFWLLGRTEINSN